MIGVDRRHAGWSRRALVACGLLLLALIATGVLLEAWPAEQVAELEPWQMQVRRAATVVHGAGAWLFCLFAGRWIWPHALMVWRRSRHRAWWLGIANAALVIAVCATGLLLLYGPANLHDDAGALHWWLALGWPVLLLLHARRLFERLPRFGHRL